MATKPKPRGRFSDCRECQHLDTWRCPRCDAGEFFEERDDSLDLDVPDYSRSSSRED